MFCQIISNRYLLLRQRRERMLSRKRQYASQSQFPNPARNPDQALTLALRKTAHKLEKLDIGVIRAFVPKFTVSDDAIREVAIFSAPPISRQQSLFDARYHRRAVVANQLRVSQSPTLKNNPQFR